MPNDAAKKIDQELKIFKEKMLKEKSENIYNCSINIIFTEGTAYYTKALAEASEELSALITVDGKTLEGATQHVMNKALQVCGGMGADLPTEQFHEFIWDFYKMPVIVAKTAIQEANEKRKIDAAEASVQRMAEMQAKKVEMPVATPIIKSKGKNISIDQMSMFDLFTSRTTDEDDGEGEGKENSANEEENVEPDLFEIEDNELETEEEIEEELI